LKEIGHTRNARAGHAVDAGGEPGDRGWSEIQKSGCCVGLGMKDFLLRPIGAETPKRKIALQAATRPRLERPTFLSLFSQRFRSGALEGS
jgi:hypothetical protein